MTKATQAKTWALNAWSDGTHRSWPEPAMPDWAPLLTQNAWTALAVTNTFSDVKAANVGQYGNTGPDFVLGDFCGAALVKERGAFGSILHWGGGHQDYYGNEVYEFDLETLTWARLSEPSTAGNADNWAGPYANGLLSDGTPDVPHTYFFLAGHNGKMVTAQRETTNLPGTTNQISQFDPGTGTWTNSNAGAPSGASGIDREGVAYDSLRDVLWLVDNDPLSLGKYDFASDTWTSFADNFHAYNPHAGQVYVPGKDALVLFNSGGVIGLDPANPTQPGHNDIALTTSGTGPTIADGDCVRWSQNLGAIVYYPSESNSIYLLTPPSGDWKTGTWVWSQPTLTGTSGTHTGNTYGKFQVVEWGAVTVAMVCSDPAGAYRAVRLA